MKSIIRSVVMMAALGAGIYVALQIDTAEASGQLAAILAIGLGFVASYGLYQHFAAMDRAELDERIMLENARKRQAEKRKSTDRAG